MLTATHIPRWLRVLPALLLWVLATSAWAEPVASIPRPKRSTWVVDLTRTLADETLEEVNRLGAEVERSGHGQLFVAVVFTTEGRSPRAFATELFNRWGIGNRRRDDGVLLFVALRDRKAEIILGDGVDTPGDVARSEALMRERIVTAFRRGDPSGAVLEGARGLRSLLEEAPLNAGLAGATAIREPPAPEVPTTKPRAKEVPAKEAKPPPRERKEFVDEEGMYVELSGSSASPEEGTPAPSDRIQEQPPRSGGSLPPGTSARSTVSPWAWAVVAGFFALLLLGNWLRRSRFACKRCGSTNVRVSSSTLLPATDRAEGLEGVTVRCQRCGGSDSFTRDISVGGGHWGSGSHGGRGSHGGGSSSGKGASGGW